jgi:hypothetical protein
MIFQLVNFKLVSYCVQKGEKSSISKKLIHQNPLELSQRKKHLNRGEKISNLEDALQNLIHSPLTICKRTLKRIYKRICKNKTCGASVVQNVKNEETIHAYLISIYIGSIPSNLCTYIMQTSSTMHFYLLWFVLASITKKGEIERELGSHLFPN